jgi:hypothetical protein
MGTPIVTFMPIGRLGNNLFTTAACIGYAKKHGFKWLVPTRRRGGDTDPYLLPQFWPNLPYGDFNGERYEQHDPSMFNYKPIPHFPNGVKLVGFFQSEKWFENAKEEVKAAFPLKHYPEYEEYVSIHVRRGDYVTHSNSFPPVTFAYVRPAMDYFRSDQKYLVFSDDIQWCKENLWVADMEFDELPTGQKHEYTKLSKMASCSHHIIANSSFSWWGAWLGHNPDKIVVSPSVDNWFGPGFTGGTPTDLIPSNWKQIKFR